MDARSVYVLLLACSLPAHVSALNATEYGGTHLNNFVVGVLEKSTLRLVTIGVPVSCHWVLTPAHPFPNIFNGIRSEDYLVLAGPSFALHKPLLVVTHPAYTWGMYTPEDFILFYVKTEMYVRQVFISAKRFPWNTAYCDYIYATDEQSVPFTQLLLHSFKVDVMVLQSCLYHEQRRPTGIVQFYLNDLLCGKPVRERPGICVGLTGGILFCEQIFIGFMTRKEWCHEKEANFTDVGCYANWLHSRIVSGHFVKLRVVDDSSCFLTPTILLIAALPLFPLTL